ncbi:MAG TPA: hypothetical protein DCM87_10500 [Planctomycetes bacterium]|nr:hypothetical protein [Planctomycetota bacterium]
MQKDRLDIESAAPEPVAELRVGALPILVYRSAEDMGLATALGIAAEQTRLVETHGRTSLMLMAAPSAFPFYRAYISLARESPELRRALQRTHFFQFDDYALPADHPASFRFLLARHFFAPLGEWTDPDAIHLLPADGADPDAAARDYGRLVIEHGPDLQVKGVGENGHWGYHEPGIPLDGEPAFIKVRLSAANAVQQMRDHPGLFATPDAVPRDAYTANVPLFLRTRVLIEDNVPQPSKALALLAAYGSDRVDSCVPSSALKRHGRAAVRTTDTAAWALREYRDRGFVSAGAIERLAEIVRNTDLGGATPAEHVARILDAMDIAAKRP